jgi:hypothetical protein
MADYAAGPFFKRGMAFGGETVMLMDGKMGLTGDPLYLEEACLLLRDDLYWSKLWAEAKSTGAQLPDGTWVSSFRRMHVKCMH